MIEKECAVCKAKSEQLTKELFLKINEHAIPLDPSAAYLDSLWNYNLQYCPECYYAAQDISICDEKTKEVILSEKYKELYTKLIALPVTDESDISYYQYALYANVCESRKDYFNASTSYFKTADQLFGITYDWKFEQLDHEKAELYEDEQETFNYLIGLSKHYLAKSLDLINLCEKGIDVLIFKAFILSAQEEIEKSEAVLTELLANCVLSPEQHGAVLIIQRDNKKVF